MFPNANTLLHIQPNTIDLVEQCLFPNTWSLIKDALNDQNDHQPHRRRPVKKSIQTQAKKGACRISKNLKQRVGFHQYSPLLTKESYTNRLTANQTHIYTESSDSGFRRPTTQSDQKTDPYFEKGDSHSRINVCFFVNLIEYFFVKDNYSDLPKEPAKFKRENSIDVAAKPPILRKDASRTLSEKKSRDVLIPIKHDPNIVQNDSFLKRIQEYRAIYLKFGATSPSKGEQNTKNTDRNKHSNQNSSRNLLSNRGKRSSNQSEAINMKRMINKTANRQKFDRDSQKANDESREGSQRNRSTERKPPVPGHIVNSSFSHIKKESKVFVNPNRKYSTPKEGILKRNKEPEKVINEPIRARSKITNYSPPHEKAEAKRADQKALNERYTRHNTKPKDRPNKGNNHDIFTLAEIQTKSDNYNMYLVNKNRFVDLDKLNYEMKSAFQLEHSLQGVEMSPKQPDSGKVQKQDVVVDETYHLRCRRIAGLLTKIMDVLRSSNMETKIDHLVAELKRDNDLFQKLSYRILKEIMKGCNIITLKNQYLYKENSQGESGYIVLYGQVYLKTRSLGVFAECYIGDSLAEEAIVEQDLQRKEAAQVFEETALVEISPSFIQKVEDEVLEEDLSGLFIILKKNLANKRAQQVPMSY